MGKWQSSCFVVPKKTPGQFRIVTDMRYPNTQLEERFAPVEPINQILTDIQGAHACFFTTIDIQHAFFSIEYEEGDTAPTAFYADCGTFISSWGESLSGRWEYSRVVMGCQPSSYQLWEVMQHTLQGMSRLKVYCDDIVGYTGTEDELLDQFEELLQRIIFFGLKICPDKVFVLMSKMDFLGFTISANGIEPQKDKLELLKKMTYPIGRKQIKSFLGFVNFFHKFIASYSYYAAQLSNLLTKDSHYNDKTEIPPQAKHAFDYLKKALLEAPT